MRFLLIFILLPISVLPQSQQPLWELGIGSGFTYGANYPASDQFQSRFIPFPIVIYRGDVFRLGDGGARAVAFQSKKWELDLSFSGAFNADSDDNPDRAGMPDLDFLFEIGPQIIYHAKKKEFKNGSFATLDYKLQTRSVFSTDFSDFSHRGYVIEPEIRYAHNGVWGPKTRISLTLESTFATEKLHDYFYQIDAPFVRPDRNQYDAQPGYLGSSFSIGAALPVTDRIQLFLGGSVNYYGGSANSDSDLYKTDWNYAISSAFIWSLYQSDQKSKSR